MSRQSRPAYQVFYEDELPESTAICAERPDEGSRGSFRSRRLLVAAVTLAIFGVTVGFVLNDLRHETGVHRGAMTRALLVAGTRQPLAGRVKITKAPVERRAPARPGIHLPREERRRGSSHRARTQVMVVKARSTVAAIASRPRPSRMSAAEFGFER